MGANINILDGYIDCYTSGPLKGIKFSFDKVSVGATINAIMAAALAKGETLLKNCACEPEIVDVCNCLVKMGAQIYGIGTRTITVVGVDKLKGAEHVVIGDRIEAGTYMIAAAMTRGRLVLNNIDYNILTSTCLKLNESGVNIEPIDNGIVVTGSDYIKPVDIQTGPYPGFATDMQAQFMSMMAIGCGRSIITENIYENRFMHAIELCRMGADIKIEGRNAIVIGVERLKGGKVIASDLRASVSLILAGLVAEGETEITEIYHLDRGYEKLEYKLSNCGAVIERS